MVLGAPRSGTTWAANWLRQEGEHVLHDPFMDFERSPASLDAAGVGISCTSSAIQYPDWLATHPAPKVLLHRATISINASLAGLGLPPIDGAVWDLALARIPGLHVRWDDLFTGKSAYKIFTHLTGREMSFTKHATLRDMNVQPAQRIIDECRAHVR